MATQAPLYPTSQMDVARWHFSPLGWAVLAFVLVVALVPFWNVLSGLFAAWNLQPEYSHGILIPPLSIFLIWRERDLLTRTPFRGSWFGITLVLAGIGAWYVAELSTIYVIGQYAFLLVLYGLVLALLGGALFRRLWMPLLILIFMIPLPSFFSNSLSLRMQLLSSSLGVDFIRLVGISVFLDGNVIDLGTYKLQVVEACDGLRYLFPLMTLAFIVAYFFRGPLWKRLVLFLASIPIAILMNSLRIGVIGVTVEYWGAKMAEGVLHDFEGWAVFMLSTIALLLLAALLVRVGQPGARLRDMLSLDFGQSPPASGINVQRTLPVPFLAAAGLTTLASVLMYAMPERVEIDPRRSAFIDFPMQFDRWEGRRSALETIYLDQLKLDDYLQANFRELPLNFPLSVWIAYYDSQRKGQSTHSPRSCLPGGGWEFESLERHAVNIGGGRMLTVNRGVIKHGSSRQVMYYWFQQRGRVVTDEYLVKCYIFSDAITRNRTDGALVRLIAPVRPGGSAAEADGALADFTTQLAQQLPKYVPN